MKELTFNPKAVHESLKQHHIESCQKVTLNLKTTGCLTKSAKPSRRKRKSE